MWWDEAKLRASIEDRINHDRRHDQGRFTGLPGRLQSRYERSGHHPNLRARHAPLRSRALPMVDWALDLTRP